jgi:hypothetical protein
MRPPRSVARGERERALLDRGQASCDRTVYGSIGTPPTGVNAPVRECAAVAQFERAFGPDHPTARPDAVAADSTATLQAFVARDRCCLFRTD